MVNFDDLRHKGPRPAEGPKPAINRLPWGAPRPALAPEEVRRIEAHERATGRVHVEVLEPLVRRSRYCQRIEQVTGLPPQTIYNTETGDWIAVVLIGESEALTWADTELGALRALAERVEGK